MTEVPEKVSIILPTYNGSKYLQQSIESCLNQTYKNTELIIVDDGSTEETSDIIKTYQDHRIKYIRHQENQGLPNALNTGFSKATGDYLTWTSDDNYYAEDAIESMVLLFQQDKNNDFIYANYYIINGDGAILQTVSVGPSRRLKEGNCIGPCFLYRRKVYEVLGGYNPDAFLAEDYEYWIRVFKQFRMKKLDKFIYWHRLHPQSLTGQHAADAKSRADRIRDSSFKFHAKIRPIWVYLSLRVKVPRRLMRALFKYIQLLLGG